RTRARLRITLAPHVVASEDARQVMAALLLGAVRDQGRAELGLAVVDDAGNPGTFGFFVIDQLLANAQPHAPMLQRPGRRPPAVLVEQAEPGAQILAAQAQEGPPVILAPCVRIMLLEP